MSKDSWLKWQKQIIREEYVKDGAANDKKSSNTSRNIKG
ncbi:Uncharacterised protein [Niallia circulans]|nr:Uncharacterised protein [Niallia circulans]